MRTNRLVLGALAASLSLVSFTGVAAAQDDEAPAECGESPNVCTTVAPDVEVQGEVVTKTETTTPTGGSSAPAAVQSAGATQQDGLGGAQGALALTGGDAVGLSVIGAGLLGAGALFVAGSRRKVEADN